MTESTIEVTGATQDELARRLINWDSGEGSWRHSLRTMLRELMSDVSPGERRAINVSLSGDDILWMVRRFPAATRFSMKQEIDCQVVGTYWDSSAAFIAMQLGATEWAVWFYQSEVDGVLRICSESAESVCSGIETEVRRGASRRPVVKPAG